MGGVQAFGVQRLLTFFALVTHAIAEDALYAHLKGDASNLPILLNQIVNGLGAIKDMQRDRKLFLDLISDLACTKTSSDYMNNIIFKNEFTSTVENKGGSARPNKKYESYDSSFFRGTPPLASMLRQSLRHMSSLFRPVTTLESTLASISAATATTNVSGKTPRTTASKHN